MGEDKRVTPISVGLDLLKKLEFFGHEAYIVGGAVRDMVMGVEPSDIDIATNCPMNILEENFRTYNIGRSKDFGIVSILFQKETFEVAQFRSDGAYSDGRRPDSIEIVSSFKDDVARRDFTVNSLAMDSRGGLIDYFGGRDSIDEKVIQTVGDPYKRFHEDRVRMVRAARFASMDGFFIEKNTRRAIRKLFRLINTVKPQRMHDELVKAASKPGPQFAKFILILDDLKLLYQILPEVAAMKYFKHDMRHHPEGPMVFDHSIACLEVMNDEPYVSKLAALFHDIGKCMCFQEDKYGWKMTYHRHEKASESLTEMICDRLKFSSFDKSAMMFAAKHHMKFHGMLKMKPSKIARLASHIQFDTLIDVAKADEFSRGERFMYRGEFDKIIKRAYEIQDKWENRVINNSLNIVSGNRIMELLELKPGRIVGTIKKAVEDRIMDERLDPDDMKLIDKVILEEAAQQIS